MIGRLFRILDADDARTLRRMLIGVVGCAVLQGVGFVLLVPVLEALLGASPSRVWPWVAALAVVFAGYAVLHWDSVMAGYRVGSTLSRRLHHLLGDHVAKLPLGWFTAARTGVLAQLTGKGVVDVMGVPAHLLRPVVTAFVTPVVVLVGMLIFDWRLAVAAAVSVPLAALTYRWSTRLIGGFDHRLDAAVADAGGRVIEFAQMQPEMRAFRRTVEGSRVLDDALVERHRASRALMLGAVPGFVSFVVVVQLAFTLVLIVGAFLALGGEVGVPQLLAVLVLAARFVEPLIAAADLGGALRMSRNALDRVDEILHTPTLPEPERSTPLGDAVPGIEFQDVRFGYREEEPVLRGLDLVVPPRSMTALVGGSGSGKTTVTKLVARFFDVHAGTVRVGGVDVRNLTTDDLMSRLALVFQDVYLFEGTIRDNIRLGKPDAGDDEIVVAARIARVDEIVARLPEGWDTQVGEGGTALSGGERQRISIARALLKDAPIVLLDEATAALDPENDAAVQDALAVLTADRTLLVIAHRLQTIAGADQIVFLDDGRIVEAGRHNDLLALDGRYARFWAERSRASGWHLRTPLNPHIDHQEIRA